MKSACAINQFQISLFEKIIPDIPDSKLWDPGEGHGHTPVWLLGHLAVSGEIGQKLLGGSIAHPAWLRMFGPGSSDPIDADRSGFSKSELSIAVVSAYEQLRALYVSALPEVLQKKHTIQIFEGTPIQTVGDVATLLLTNHFGFHLAQLSSIRRGAGFPHLF